MILNLSKNENLLFAIYCFLSLALCSVTSNYQNDPYGAFRNPTEQQAVASSCRNVTFYSYKLVNIPHCRCVASLNTISCINAQFIMYDSRRMLVMNNTALKYVQSLTLHGNNLGSLNASFITGRAVPMGLKFLNLSSNMIYTIHKNVFNSDDDGAGLVSRVETLDLSDNNFQLSEKRFNAFIKAFHGLKRLFMRRAFQPGGDQTRRVYTFNALFENVQLPNLVELDLSRNRLWWFPSCLCSMKTVKILHFGSNPVRDWSLAPSCMDSLRNLTLSDNYEQYYIKHFDLLDDNFRYFVESRPRLVVTLRNIFIVCTSKHSEIISWIQTSQQIIGVDSVHCVIAAPGKFTGKVITNINVTELTCCVSSLAVTSTFRHFSYIDVICIILCTCVLQVANYK